MADQADELLEIWRGPFREGVHRGHVAIWHHDTGLVASWGDAEAVILPRSSAKMIQALPLVESGAAKAAGLTTWHLALACASHQGAALHHGMVSDWLGDLGLDERALRCGCQWPNDTEERDRLIRAHGAPDQMHNNCSGKHSGFLTLAQHLGAGPEYLDIDHPVQVAVRHAFEEVTGEDSPGYGIDGCSAPNFATRLKAFARAMAAYAAAGAGGGVRDDAMVTLRDAMAAHPDLVAGEGRACTRLMRAMNGRASIKTGAEAVFAAIIPERRMGVAVKIDDGGTRAAEAVITQILIAMGVLDPDHPDAVAFSHGPIRNWRGIETGHLKVSDDLARWRP
ncbi:Hypothetical protein of L-Asparaginase type 2-like superfamily [Roseibacterium elongatum DSM 19469]|uniref:Asparaginase n=1 Tax=Roseicyclus elongatus DSM 19469 TaxID=1294273 RepID=W8SLH5_9RHOB|nr:asparaginase [Roseibacterium elongatum]AHM03390.1 Hypothetical protein of L-Asparaginase type 2-like superfamily [Roseibacterium elongatum DSM 19469]